VDDMREYTQIEYVTRVHASVESVFDFHIRFDNIKKITPPYPVVRILNKPEKLKKDTSFAVGLFFLPLIGIYWESQVETFEENRRFSDKQISIAPFQYWIHEHEFKREGDLCVIIDRVRYKMHFGLLGKIIDFVLFRHLLRLFFFYRSYRLRRIFPADRR
jgi:ligand-binding SRPBCC domain-containing protein